MVNSTEYESYENDIAPVTLQQLAVSFAIGSVVLAVTLLLFAAALRLRITHVAPRCEARPRDVIYNPSRDCDASQKRGNPFLLGWVFWSLQLSYHTMIEGVPGTGTRNDGLSGNLLKVNLDSIVLLRFHAMALRIACFAAVVYCGICMPLYRTARCYDNPLQEDNEDISQSCNTSAYNLTRYEKLTLANVPSLNEVQIWDEEAPEVTFRLYMVVVCTYMVCWFVCYQLHKEWIDLLAMRRVYYLEYDHWEGSRKELKATMMQSDLDSPKHSSTPKEHLKDYDNPHLHQRQAWIHHPEMPDTPPSIELYSVLVGGLPKRPLQAVSEEDLEVALSDEDNAMDWQLSIASAFFDYCVPNQPGFSSSVAAVTILPSASELATAWNKWNIATQKLQRLRLIRRTLLERGHQDEHGLMAQYKDDADGEGSPQETDQQRNGNNIEVNFQDSLRRERYKNEVLGEEKILGAITDEDVEAMFLKSLHLGPEQTAVYSIELAQGSSGCCPYGCCEEKIRWSKIETLLEMEEQAMGDARDAFIDLELARKKVAAHEQSDALSTRPTLLSAVRPSAFWFDKSEHVAARGESVEFKLFEKGNATLEEAQLKHQTRKDKLQSKYANRQGIGDQPNGEIDTNSSSASGNSAPPANGASNNLGAVGLRPRLQTERSSYFPSLLKPNVPVDFDANTVANSRRRSYFPSLLKPNVPIDFDANTVTNDSRQKELSFRSSKDSSPHPWELVTKVATESEIGAKETGHVVKIHSVSDGVWHRPSLSFMWTEFWKQTCSFFSWTVHRSDLATDILARDSTFAVVTFTSRQAAIAARRCLADGRGAEKWVTIDDLPVPPLADASAFNIYDCRGCGRPVTLTLNDHQKILRNYVALVALAFIYVGYTYPITVSATFGSERVSELLPALQLDSDELYGFIRAQLINLFLAFCPYMFLAIANFGSNATSMVGAEFAAMQYYWWFFLLFALLGSSILQMVLRAFDEGSLDFQGTLQKVAATIPSQVSSAWTNWIILKTLIFHPLSYLLQLHSFLLAACNLKVCVRLGRGGGSGDRVPYRWYVESGMVLMFVLALAPAAPILSPFAVLYFIVCQPILRHVLIFTYKPQFGGGGIRFPFLFDMVISSMIVSQVLMSTMLLLKNAVGPAVVAILLSIPTLVFRRTCRRRFLRAYQDAALLQTSLLDGWDTDTSEHASTQTMAGREEFRRFLVDSHKAAYVPVCIAGTNTDKILTAEPAVVVPTSTDTDFREVSTGDLPPPLVTTKVPSPQSESKSVKHEQFLSRSSVQFGAVMRRSAAVISLASLPQERHASASTEATKDVDAGASGSPIRISSIGLIREGLDSEKCIVDIKEAMKDK